MLKTTPEGDGGHRVALVEADGTVTVLAVFHQLSALHVFTKAWAGISERRRCPFCFSGSSSFDRESQRIVCSNCEARGPRGYGHGYPEMEQHASNGWNARPVPG